MSDGLRDDFGVVCGFGLGLGCWVAGNGWDAVWGFHLLPNLGCGIFFATGAKLPCRA